MKPAIMSPRQRAFLKALPRNNNKVKPSAIEAGYGKGYAHGKGQVILRNAIEAQANELARQAGNKDTSPKELGLMMFEILGMTRQELIDNLKYMAQQSKDLTTRLKIIAPLVKQLGIDLTPETTQISVPILNIGVRSADLGQNNAQNALISPVDNPVDSVDSTPDTPLAPPENSTPTDSDSAKDGSV